MVALALVISLIFILLLASEMLWRRREMHPEYARKFIHITVGSFVAFWPLYLDHEVIVGLSAAFVMAVIVSYKLNIFKAIHSVQRPTWGEVFFALAVGTLALVSSSGWIYLVALLHMSLADGLAAVVGIRFGKSTRYYVFGHAKSVVGSVTFMVVSVMIFAVYCWLTRTPFSPWFLAITLAATAIENLAVRGLDNLLVPLLVALGLNLIRY